MSKLVTFAELLFGARGSSHRPLPGTKGLGISQLPAGSAMCVTVICDEWPLYRYNDISLVEIPVSVVG